MIQDEVLVPKWPELASGDCLPRICPPRGASGQNDFVYDPLLTARCKEVHLTLDGHHQTTSLSWCRAARLRRALAGAPYDLYLPGRGATDKDS